MEKYESRLKSRLVQVLRDGLPGYVIFPHQDVITFGIPDLSVNERLTSWLELKHGTPNFRSHGRQELNMLRLARAGIARYVIYIEQENGTRRTWIVHPEEVTGKQGLTQHMKPEHWCEGFDHAFVLLKVKQLHEGPWVTPS